MTSSFGLFGPFSWANTGAVDPNLTTTYYDSSGSLARSNTGNILNTPTGFNSSYPLGLPPANANDLLFNTKSIYFDFETAGFIIGAFANGSSSSSATGILGRIISDSASIYGRKFIPMFGAPGSKTSVSDIMIDFTQCFSKLTTASDFAKQYVWLPQITFNIASSSGAMTIGQAGDNPVDFTDFHPPILNEFYVTSSLTGSLDGSAFATTMAETERYDDIYFAPYKTTVGSTISIVSPPSKVVYDDPGFRTGFADLYSIQFTGAAPTTTFNKILSPKNVYDTVQVIVPVGAKTGPISFKTKYSSTNALLYDWYQSSQSIVIS